MRQILVDYARQHRAAKRSPGVKVEFDENRHTPPGAPVDVLELDSALSRLSERDPQQALMVELRFFGGLTLEETAEALDISPATVKREWVMAKAWLTRAMTSRQNSAGQHGTDQAVAHS